MTPIPGPAGPRQISSPDASGFSWWRAPNGTAQGDLYRMGPQGQKVTLGSMISSPAWRGPVGAPGGEPPEETTRMRPPVSGPNNPQGLPGFGTWNAAGPMGDTPSIYAAQPTGGSSPGPYGNSQQAPYADTPYPGMGGVQTPVFNGPQAPAGPPPAVTPPPGMPGPGTPPAAPPSAPPTQTPPANPWVRNPNVNVPGQPRWLEAPPQQPSGMGQINTSITPQNIYTPQQTQETINTTRAIAAQNANLPWLLRQYARPGVSQRSPSALGQAIPQIAQAQSAIARAPTEISFGDDLANMDHFRAGQVSREQEAQGMAGGLLRMQDIGRNLQSTQANLLAQLLGRFA